MSYANDFKIKRQQQLIDWKETKIFFNKLKHPSWCKQRKLNATSNCAISAANWPADLLRKILAKISLIERLMKSFRKAEKSILPQSDRGKCSYRMKKGCIWPSVSNSKIRGQAIAFSNRRTITEVSNQMASITINLNSYRKPHKKLRTGAKKSVTKLKSDYIQLLHK